ncbi:MAG: patatin-like phospholipase family protein [Luteibacter jiangsuensis]
MSDFDIADPGALPVANAVSRKPRIALALGAGAAKGLAHIGAIEALEEHGYEVVAVAGTSMGALIGGIYAMGKLDIYRDWVSTLARFDVLRLVDWSFSGGGFIKGDRIMAALRELIGEVNIEELELAYTAVATDIDREREVWLTRGPLFDAIRASIAIPTLFRPYTHEGRRRVDGAQLNPLPVLPQMREDADYGVAVSVDGAAEMQKPPEKDVAAVADKGYAAKLGRLIGRVLPQGEQKIRDPGAFELMTQSMDLMQANLSRLRLAAYPPDLLIEIPRNVSTVYEFYRARELIELGRERTVQALEAWKPRTPASR